MKKFLNYITELIYPPRCVMCGELLDPGTERVCFCDMCRGIWESEKTAQCPECRRRVNECGCQPKYNKSRTVDSFRTLSFYDSDNVKKLIKTVKTDRDPALEALLGRDLSSLIMRYYKIDGDCVVAYPNRDRISVKKYGFDHARLLCKKVSEYTGVPVYPYIKHRHTRQQKTLSAKERGYNAVRSYYIPDRYRDLLKNKRVIFIDDVVTTGATSVVCASLCKAAGASGFSVFSVARTQ